MASVISVAVCPHFFIIALICCTSRWSSSSLLWPPLEPLLCSCPLCTPFISLAPGGVPGLGCQWDWNVSVPLQSVGSVYSGLMQGVGAAEKVFEFIDRQPTMVHDGNLAPEHLEGRVDFENVTFTYRTRPHTQVLQVRGGLRLPPPIFLSLILSCAHLPQARLWHYSQEYDRGSPSPPWSVGSSWGRQIINERISG